MSTSNLALVLRGQGKYEQAEETYRQALGLIEKSESRASSMNYISHFDSPQEHTVRKSSKRPLSQKTFSPKVYGSVSYADGKIARTWHISQH
jgi:hypothetical protein